MKHQKAIYIIGGGPLGLNIIEWAKEIGLKTIVTDRNKYAPGLKMADESFIVDAADFESHLGVVKELGDEFRIVGFYCGNEIGIWSIYHLSKRLNLYHNPKEALQNVLDKVKMKHIWEMCKIPTPRSYIAKNSQELQKIEASSEYQLIAKPALGSGSRGVQILNERSHPKKVFDGCLQAVGGQGDVIAEEYLCGRSIDANGIFISEKFYPGGILEKYITNAPDCLPIAGNDPAAISELEQMEVYALLEQASRTLGLNFGPVKGDFIRTNEGYKILEVAPRFHGDVTTSNTLSFGSGINPVKFYFHYLQTGEINSDFLRSAQINYATWRVICLPPGRMRQKCPCDFDNAVSEQITKVWHNPRCFLEIDRYTDTSKIPGYICAFGEDQQEVENLLTQFWGNQKDRIDVNAEHLPWYEQLGERIAELGFSKSSFGYVDCS